MPCEALVDQDPRKYIHKSCDISLCSDRELLGMIGWIDVVILVICVVVLFVTEHWVEHRKAVKK